MFEGFRKKKTLEELEGESERLTVEEEIVSKRADIVEREAVISELKSRYGGGWAKTLGISKFASLTTLRSFLTSAKQGLRKEASAAGGTPLSAITSFKGVHKA